MAAIQYARLYPDTTQLQAKNGTNLTAGWVMVFLAGTDDPATTYADFNGTLNPQKIVIDDNGRFTAIVDKSQAYRVEVYDSEGMLQWTTEPVWCTGNSGSGMSVTRVVSTDGSISVDENIAGTERTYDIGLAPSSNEFLEWCKTENSAITNGYLYPVFYEGTMTTDEGGLHVYKDRYYHVTCTFRVDPTGNGINYDTLSVNLKFSNGTEVDLVRRNYDIDNSVNDPTLCEFSYDFNCPADGYLYLYVEGVSSFEQVDVALQVHRVYSGINAVPDTCATQQWVRGYFDFNMSAHIPYSALEYDANNEISGISGSAIAGNMNSAQVSAIASSYAESAVSSLSGSISSKLDASASGMFQLSGDYYSASNPSGFISNADLSSFAKESSLSSKLDASASSEFYSTSNPSGFLTAHQSLSGYATEAYVDSSVSSKLDTTAFSTVSGDFLTSHQSLAGYATESYVDSAVSGKLDVTASSQFLTSLPDDLAYTRDVASAVSGKMDKSESSSFYPMDSNPSGYLTAHQSLAGLATEQYVDSAVSSKLDASAYDSAWFQPSSSMSAWIPYSALDYSGTAISGIGGSSLAGMGGGGGADYSGVAPVNVDNDTRLISVDHRTLCVDDTMTAYNSGTSAVLGVNVAGLDLSGKADSSALSSYVPYSSLEYNTASAISGINGSALAAGSTYSAGEGIDITDDVISVEAPVDIVAGPGIVVDNPDGNTLRVSTDENYEVVLFSGTAANTNVALNEALDNFERIKIYAYWKGTNTYEYYGYSVTEIYTSELSVGKRFTVNVFCNLNDSEFYSIANFSVASTKTQLNVVNVKRASLTEQLIAQNDGPTVYKVVGIHRITNN